MLFDDIDKDHDHKLSHGEIRKHLKAAPWALPWIKSEAFHWKDIWEGGWDSDNDGYLSEEEFSRFYEGVLVRLIKAAPATPNSGAPVQGAPSPATKAAPGAGLASPLRSVMDPIAQIELQLAAMERSRGSSSPIAVLGKSPFA